MIVDAKKVNKFALDMALNANEKIFSFLHETGMWYIGSYCGFCVSHEQAYINVKKASDEQKFNIIGRMTQCTRPLTDTKHLIRSMNGTLLRIFVTDENTPVYVDDKFLKYFPKKLSELFGSEHSPEKNPVVVRDAAGDAIGIIMPTQYHDSRENGWR